MKTKKNPTKTKGHKDMGYFMEAKNVKPLKKKYGKK